MKFLEKSEKLFVRTDKIIEGVSGMTKRRKTIPGARNRHQINGVVKENAIGCLKTH